MNLGLALRFAKIFLSKATQQLITETSMLRVLPLPVHVRLRAVNESPYTNDPHPGSPSTDFTNAQDFSLRYPYVS